MAIGFAFLMTGALIYCGWNLLVFPFAKGLRKRRLLKAGASLFAAFMFLNVYMFLSDRDAQQAGFINRVDQRNAEEAGIKDPTAWSKIRPQKLAELAQKKAKAEADAARQAYADNMRKEIEAAEREKAKKEEEQLAAKKEEAKLSACKADLQCWGEEASIEVSYECTSTVERMAKHDFEWTDGMLEPKFSHYRWADKKAGIVTIIGDKIKMQNGFGAWTHMTYECDVDPATKSLVDVRVTEGRI